MMNGQWTLACRKTRLAAVLAICLGAFGAEAWAQPVVGQYSLDDGAGELNTGAEASQPVELTTWWANAFTAAPDFDLIFSIDVAWGGDGDLVGGEPATVLLYDDPNDDFDPTDLVLLASAPTTLQDPEQDIFHAVPITPTLVEGVFFVAVIMDHSNGAHPAAVDTSSVLNKSRMAIDFAGGIDPADVYGTALHTIFENGNYLLRASATTITTDTAVIDDGFAPGSTPGALGYSSTIGPSGVVEVIDDPGESGDGMLRLFDPGSDPVHVRHAVAMDASIVIEMAYQFLTDGKLVVKLDGQIVDTIIAPADGAGRDVWDLYQHPLTLADLGLERGNHELSLELLGVGDPELLIDSLRVTSSIPEPAAMIAMLALGGWFAAKRGRGHTGRRVDLRREK